MLIIEAEMPGGIEIHADGSGEFIDIERLSINCVEAVRNPEAVMFGVGKLAGSENAKRRRLGWCRRSRLGRTDIRFDNVVNNVVKGIQRRVDNRAVGHSAKITVGV
ncbi:MULTISPECIES: hypothetical protein [Mesorhizobium]|nr:MULTISPECIES: hypothetical protein [Mesorhizobium]MDX8434436.1 hypothetical protein [Mesorhizobium abyssinicae]